MNNALEKIIFKGSRLFYWLARAKIMEKKQNLFWKYFERNLTLIKFWNNNLSLENLKSSRACKFWSPEKLGHHEKCCYFLYGSYVTCKTWNLKV